MTLKYCGGSLIIGFWRCYYVLIIIIIIIIIDVYDVPKTFILLLVGIGDFLMMAVFACYKSLKHFMKLSDFALERGEDERVDLKVSTLRVVSFKV